MQRLLDDIGLGTMVKSEVYHKLDQDRLGHKQQRVLDILNLYEDGLTDKEISILSGFSLSCVNARRNELMEQGLVVPYTIYTFVSDETVDGNVPNIVWGIKK